MFVTTLLVFHIAVLGYWLGSEFVINSTYRYVCYQTGVPFAERTRLMAHVMDVDQHVRYALILQASLGTVLAALYGYIPGGTSLALAASVFGVVWLAFVEVVHRNRTGPVGATLQRIDRATRYALLLLLAAVATGIVGSDWAMPAWLRWKLAAFAAVIACGIGIRIALLRHFATWAEMSARGVTAAANASIQRTYRLATGILVLLWCFIAIIVFLSISKPS
jgi:hypothetical protein